MSDDETHGCININNFVNLSYLALSFQAAAFVLALVLLPLFLFKEQSKELIQFPDRGLVSLKSRREALRRASEYLLQGADEDDVLTTKKSQTSIKWYMLYVTGFVVLVAISAEYLYFNQGDSISTQYRKGGFNSIVDGEFFIETLILSLPGSLIFVLWSQFSYLARTMNSCIHTFCVQVWFISLLTIMVTIAVDGIMYALILVMISFGVITLIGFVALCYLFMPLFVEVTRWFEIMRGYHGCSDVGLWFDLILSAFKCIGLCKLGGRKHYVFHQLNDEPEENDPVEDAYYTFTDDKRVYYAKVLYVRNDNTYDIQYVRDNDPQIIKSIMTNGVDSVLENYRTCYVKYDEISAAIEVFDTETIDTFKEQYEIGDVVKLKRRRRPCNFIVPHGQVKVENSHVGRLPYHSMYYTDCYVDIAMSCTVVAVNLQEGSFDIQAEISELKKRYYRVIPDGTGDYLSYRARLVILRDDHKVDNSMGSKSIAGAEMNSEKSNFSIEDYPVDVQTVSVKYNKQFNFSKAKSKKGSGSNFSTNVRHKVGEILTIFDCNCQIIRRSSHSKWYCKIKNSSFYTEKDYAPISHLHPKNIVDATLYYDRLVTILPERGDDYVTTANRPSDFNLSDVSDQTRNPIALSPRLGTPARPGLQRNMLVKNGTKRFSVDSDSNTAGEDGRDSLESENSTIDQENVAPQELKRLKKSTCCSCFADDTPSFMEDYGNESVPQTAKLLKDLKNGHYQVLYKNKALKTVSYHRINFVPRKDVAKEIFGAIIQRKYSDESIVSDTRNTILQNPSTERSFSLFAIIQQINKYYNASRRLLWFNLSVGDPRTTNIIVLLVLLVGSFIVFYASMAFPLLVTHGFSNLGSYCVDLNANEFNLFGTIFSLSGASGIFSFYYNYFVAGDEDDDDDDKKAKKKSNGVELIEETKETEPLKGMTDKEKLRFARKKGLIVQYCKECQVPVRIRKRNTVVFICKNDHVNECLMSGSDLDIV